MYTVIESRHGRPVSVATFNNLDDGAAYQYADAIVRREIPNEPTVWPLWSEMLRNGGYAKEIDNEFSLTILKCS